MKALMIAPQPVFSPRGTPFSVYYRMQVAASLGVSIDLLTYGEGEDFDLPGVRIVRIPRFSFLGEIRIGPSFLKLFYDMIMVAATVILLIRNRYDFVHAHEEAVFFCRFLKPLFRFKLVYDMHSSLPQQLTNFDFTKLPSVIGLFRALEDSALRSSDAVITICPDLSDYVEGLLVDSRKHFLIENSIFDPVRLLPCPEGRKGAIPEGVGEFSTPGDRRLVVYAGTLEPYQGIDILLGAFEEVVQKAPDAFLVIAGGTPVQVRRYKAMAEAQGISEAVRFTGRIPQAEAKRLVKKASLLVSPRSEGTNTPLKIYEQLASGIPLVATDIYSHTQVLDDRVAFLVAPRPDAMAEGMLTALRSGQRSRKVAENARGLYETRYSREAYEKKMARLLEGLSCAG